MKIREKHEIHLAREKRGEIYYKNIEGSGWGGGVIKLSLVKYRPLT